jgi:hypothetical protein
MLRALEDAGVVYCHWKSNEAIAKSLVADNDLDLLVARRDAPAFSAALHTLGFRIARPSPDRMIPGMVDYLGLDAETGRMVHVQAHYQLVLGDDMTKNFRIPLEDAYLESRVLAGPIPVPSHEFELLIFVLRMVLKHCPLDAQLSRKGRLTPSERRELAHLEAGADLDIVDALRAEHLPTVSAELFAECRLAMADDAGHPARAVAGRHLVKALEPWARSSVRSDLVRKLWRRWRRRRTDGAPRSRRVLDSGGLLLAVVGGDGSGKSSAVAALGQTFSRHFPTNVVHMGKPARSFRTRLVRGLLRRLPGTRNDSRTSLPAWTDFETTGYPGLVFVVAHTLTARDRYRAYRRARRAAAQGTVVVCDRFPLDAITLMDGPRCADLPGLEQRPLARRLAAAEAAYYRWIHPPDRRTSCAGAPRRSGRLTGTRRRSRSSTPRSLTPPFSPTSMLLPGGPCDGNRCVRARLRGRRERCGPC